MQRLMLSTHVTDKTKTPPKIGGVFNGIAVEA
jgi:hypothetical protein